MTRIEEEQWIREWEKKRYNSKATIAIPPGETIKKFIGKTGISRKQLCYRLGLTDEKFDRLLEGKLKVTPDRAAQLGKIFKTSTFFWYKLQVFYDLDKKKNKDEKLKDNSK